MAPFPAIRYILIFLFFAHVLLEHLLTSAEDRAWHVPVWMGFLTALCFFQPIGLLAGMLVGGGYAIIRWLQTHTRSIMWWHYVGAHVISLLLLTVMTSGLANSGSGQWLTALGGPPAQTLAVLTGVLLMWGAGSRFVTLLVTDIEFQPKQCDRGLPDAGKVIGQLERTLILFLVIAGVPSGIGFLIAAKSILRFGEVKEPGNREMAEYVLIGTLASFTFAVPVAYGVAELIKWAQ